MSAKPLKVPATNGKASSSSSPSDTKTSSSKTAPSSIASTDISSPHELTAFVETILSNLETRFDDMSSQVLDKMNQMSTRVDSLELAMQDLLNDTYMPGTPGAQGAQGSTLGKVDE
ncbi:hypothetical protein FRC03_004459 [Tulasnella sp. 419]|nr:hypothetical protein FRC02_003717 [Tulasnella sp. 418]KAG8962261.1 hypothetical protein FRC03_004459 [Tulasnella sp. 419]